MPDEKEVITNIWVHGIHGCNCCSEDTACGEHGEDMVNLVFDIPGTAKDKIDLRVTEKGLKLEAWRDKTTRYLAEYVFTCDASPPETKADYKEGVLSVTVPLTCNDPFTDVPRVQVN